jgi:hypothetical protein
MADAKGITESGVNIFGKSANGITYEGTDADGNHVYTVGGGKYLFVAGPDEWVEPDTQAPIETTTDGETTTPTEPVTPSDPAETQSPDNHKRGCSSTAMSVAVTMTALLAPMVFRKRKRS